MQIGWLKVNAIEAIKQLDPISFKIAKDEYLDSLVSDSELVEVNGNYYWNSDIENFIEEKLSLQTGA